MIEAAWEVIIDLFRFVFPIEVKAASKSQPIPAKETHCGISSISVPPAHKTLVTGETAHIIKANSICFARPILAFDTRLGYFLFGELVTVALVEGQFAYVVTQTLSGWVDVRDISYRKEEVFPELVLKKKYTAGDVETVTMRHWLTDECDGGALYLALQPAEFILYQLKIRKIDLVWPAQRPRTAGIWQSILKGKPRVHISIEPKTASIMEYYKEDKSAVLAFLAAVHPDESIVVESVGKEVEGEFLVETLTSAQWRELRPVFISFA